MHQLKGLVASSIKQGMRYEFGSAGAVCSIKESSGTQNQRVHIVLKASKSVGARTRRSLVHRLLHPQILRLLVLLKRLDFEAQSSLLYNKLHPQIQIPNACPGVILF